MTLTIELDERIERAAMAHGESPADYVRKATERRLQEEPSMLSREEKSRLIDESLQALRDSGASLGRNGKPWREFLDESF